MTDPRPNISVDTAVFTDAISKANRVAPTKGKAFDKAAGVMLEIRPAEKLVVVRSTNMETTFRQEVPLLSTTMTENADWRTQSALLAGILVGFPGGTETTITPQGDNRLELRCGKARSKINTFPEDGYPRWAPITDPDTLVNVPGFAARVAQVSWACDSDLAPLSGVYIDGERLVATDRYRLATVPCVVPVDEPISVPLDVLAPILRDKADARLRAEDKRLLLMPDDFVQMTSVIFDAKYPKIERITATEYNAKAVLDRDAVRQAVSRMLVLVKGERYPVMLITIGEGLLKIFIDVPDVGEMEDEIVVEGADHPEHLIYFTPTNFIDGLTNAGAEKVLFEYDTDKPHAIVKLSSDDQYECWLVPRQKPTAADPT